LVGEDSNLLVFNETAAFEEFGAGAGANFELLGAIDVNAFERLGAGAGAGPELLGAIEGAAFEELGAGPGEAPEPKISANWDGMAALFKDWSWI
jgi:hypothetical protein